MNIGGSVSRKSMAINKIKERKIIEINQEENNKKCFDCQSLNPQYISLYNGIFICRRCVNDLHRHLNSNISLILDNNLKKLSIKEIQYLYYGGNKKLLDFINYEYPVLKTINRNKLYLTKGMEYYRLWLKFLIDEGEKPLKPSFEECSKLINEVNRNKFNNKNMNKGNIITIDFINNYYNYEDDEKYNIINPKVYEKTYIANRNNNLNQKKEFSTYNRENEINLSNSLNTNYYNNRTLMNENEKNDYYINNDYNNLNNNVIDLDKFNTNINSNSISSNKLITKRLNLKSKNKGKNLSMSRNENSTNIVNKTLMNILTNEKNKIYTKPKHTLLTSFQKNAPTRNKIETGEFQRRTYVIPTGNNYQSILINNNNFDKLLMYNFTDRISIPSDNIKMNEKQFLKQRTYLNSAKILNTSSNFENSNRHSKKDLTVFKKKTLKNSFSINSRKIKDKKDDINHSIVEENTNFQIIPDKSLENILNERNHIKLNSSITNSISIESKKDIEILNEIKVKKRERYVITGNKYNNKTLNTLNKLPTKNIFERYDTLNENDKDLSTLKYNSKNVKETKMRKLLTLTRLMKNKTKIPVTRLNFNNSYLVNDKKNRINETAREKDGGAVDNIKNIILSNKRDKVIKQNIIDKKAKEIFLMENSGKKVRVYKTENTYNKSYDNIIGKPKYKTKRVDVINPYQNQIKKISNLKDNKNEFDKVNQTQRKKEILNYLFSKKLNG